MQFTISTVKIQTSNSSNWVKFITSSNQAKRILTKGKKYEEKKTISIAYNGRTYAENWLMPKSASDFYMLKVM